MAVRLKYAGLTTSKFVLEPGCRESLDVLGLQKVDQYYILASYTSLFNYAKLLRKMGKAVAKMRIRACHLYPDVLNLYGDRGTCWFLPQSPVAGYRGGCGSDFAGRLGDFNRYDFIFIGGGSDSRRTWF